MQVPTLGVSDFVALVNQSLEYTFGSVLIVGELANFRVSKNRWVYFDLKDAAASVRFFGTVYSLPGPLEEGMVVEVRGAPRLHPQFGFSVTFESLRPVGEGAIRKAAELLQVKLEAEGLFADGRKRLLPYPPGRIGLITSRESAAYADFTKILAVRWGGLDISLADVQVQGEPAAGQIVTALQWFNEQADAPELLVLIRGGGSADDLAAFSSEQVVRAVAASRIPTLVAIGHEVDTSLAELAADVRASTPSNAAELLVPDKRDVLVQLAALRLQLGDDVRRRIRDEKQAQQQRLTDTAHYAERLLERERQAMESLRRLTLAYNPAAALVRGYAVVRDAQGRIVRGVEQLHADGIVSIRTSSAEARARIISSQGVDNGKNL